MGQLNNISSLSNAASPSLDASAFVDATAGTTPTADVNGAAGGPAPADAPPAAPEFTDGQVLNAADAPGAAVEGLLASGGPPPAATADSGGVLGGAGQITCGFHPGVPDGVHPHGHKGIDLAAPAGTPVHATRAGTVLYSGTASGYGHWVVVKQGDGTNAIYGHVGSAGLPKVGSTVEPGQVIGHVTKEGDSTGPHLHLQVERNGKAIDPSPYLK